MSLFRDFVACIRVARNEWTRRRWIAKRRADITGLPF